MASTIPDAPPGAGEPPPGPLARLLAEWSRDALLVALGIALLLAARAALTVSLWGYAGPRADTGGVLVALLRGFPFDCRTTVVALLPSIAFSLTALGRSSWAWPRARRVLRTVLGTLFTITVVLLTAVEHFYFREYANQFDHFVVGFIYDDTSAILRTVWQQYPVVWAALGLLLATAGGAWVLWRLTRWTPLGAAWFARRRIALQALLTVIALAAIVCGARGSVSRLPAQSKNVAVTADDKLLNKMVLNPLAALQGAVNDYRDARADGGRWKADEARAAARRLSGIERDLPDLDAYLERTARGPDPGAPPPPRHIVVLLMESYSGWALGERYRALGLGERLRGLADGGLAFPRFTSEGAGTIYSVGPLLTGLPDAGPMQSFQPLARRPFPTSLAPIFKRLGYRTRFFYSGYLSWQRLGDFVDGQGFDQIDGGGVISDWTSGNEWGVEDARLLAYVADHQIDSVPTLDVVLTTSNHPPYSIDVFARGFPHRTMPEALGSIADDTADLRILGHLWYSDRALGDFVAAVSRAQPDTLFVITGDHYGRRFINRAPGPWERIAVPGVLYGPAVAGRHPAAAAGGHLDLIPTLVELCAPAGFPYHAVGVDLLHVAQDAAATRVGALSAAGAVEWTTTGDAVGVSPAQLSEWQRRSADRMAVGWWRLMKGPELKD